MRHQDNPITVPSEDLLDRTEFAESMARSIRFIDASKSGFVLGLTGEWGGGKSSVIALIKYFLSKIEIVDLAQGGTSEIRHDNYDEYFVLYKNVEFIILSLEAQGKSPSMTPRSYLINSFDKVLKDDEKSNKAYEYWRMSCLYEAKKKVKFVDFSPWLFSNNAELATTMLTEIGRSIGAGFGLQVQVAFRRYAERFAEFAPLVGAGVDVLIPGGGFSFASTATSMLARKSVDQLTGPTLADLKSDLETALSSLGDRKLLVVLDDLDRLLPNEALQIASIVKGLGSLPNVIYLMSYHANRFEKLIAQAILGGAHISRNRDEGFQYLEKIIQYKRNLPHLDSSYLADMFWSEINEIIQNSESASIEERDLAEIWENITRHYIKGPRDVKRLSNALTISVPALREAVDIADLLVVETLSLFDPDVYEFVRNEIESLRGAA